MNERLEMGSEVPAEVSGRHFLFRSLRQGEPEDSLGVVSGLSLDTPTKLLVEGCSVGGQRVEYIEHRAGERWLAAYSANGVGVRRDAIEGVVVFLPKELQIPDQFGPTPEEIIRMNVDEVKAGHIRSSFAVKALLEIYRPPEFTYERFGTTQAEIEAAIQLCRERYDI